MSISEDEAIGLQLMREARVKQRLNEDTAKCEKSLAYFIRQAWSTLKPVDPYVHNWHIDAVCEKLEAVSAGDIHRLQIWIPPGTSKPVDVDALVLMGDGSRKLLGDIEIGDYVSVTRDVVVL